MHWRTGVLIVIMLSTSLLAENVERLAENSDKAPSNIKKIADSAKTLAGYYSAAKTGYDVVLTLADALGWIDTKDTDERLDELTAQLNSLSSAVSWIASKNFIDMQRGPAIAAIRSLQRTGTTTAGSLIDRDTAAAAQTLRLGGGAFYRPYNKKLTEGPWTNAIDYTKEDLLPQGDGSLVWDWRLGIPALLEVSGYRIQVIAAIDPDFRRDRTYNIELEDYRSSLESDLDTMLAGVRCGRGQTSGTALPAPEYSCADIRTGIWAGYSSPRVDDPLTYEEIITKLRGEVVRQMPLFEVRSVIDTLYFYEHGLSDLAELDHRIPAGHAASLCLDVQWGNPAAGTPLWLWRCDGNPAQQWVYDRRNSRIYNPAYDKCLDVSYASGQIGTPVWTWECNGTDAQRWTYDYRTGILENAIGTTLDIQFSNVEQGTPVWTWSRNETAAQRWRADQYYWWGGWW